MSVIRYSVKSQEFPNFYKTERHPVSYSKLKCLAKALFDNNAESPDELAFRKGDILTVLEQNTRGLEGWWLCALRGRQGIVPGNRVRLIPGMYEPVESGYETKAHAATSLDQVDETNISPSSESTQRIWHLDSKKVVTPQKLGYVDVLDDVKVSQDYDVPKSFNSIKVKETKFGDFLRVHTTTTTLLQALENSDLDVYDIPRSAVDLYDFLQGNKYDDPDGLLQPAKSFLKEEIGDYDIPKSCSRPVYNTKDMSLDCDTRSGLTSPLSLSSSSTSSTKSSYSSLCTSLSNRCSMEDKQEPYDIPFRDPRHVNIKSSPQPFLTSDSDSLLQQAEPLCDVSQCNILSNQQTSPEESMQIHIQGLYDVPPRVTRDPSFSVNTEESCRSQSASGEELQTLLSRCIVGKELPLERRTAIELCTKRYEDVNSAIQMLFNCVNDKRNVRSVCKKLKTTMHEFIELALGALSNCTHSSDKGLSTKLAKLLKPLIESSTYIEGTIDMESYTSEELDKLVVCACSLVEDLKLVACFIRSNSSLIFKRSNNDIYDKTAARTVASDFSSSNSTNKESTQVRPSESFTGLALEDKKTDQEWLKQYDCVKLEHVGTSKKENWKTENAAVREVKNSYDNHTKSFTDLVQKEIPKNITSKNSSQVDENGLDSNELQLLHFYKYQIEAENIRFTNSIDAFLVTIRNKQPPKIFLQHCKSVIISASRIVYIGDTVHKNVNESTIKTNVFQKSNTLWDSIKYFVTNAKKAASIFPSAVAIQEMEESIVDVSSKANDLKAIIGNIC
ncbi:breast cancer anti-estrogen resistance protein 1-like [Tachypleus tridentatus]|uniref:breast cancer anti-estrogen resistance protein 1-like n=1 Tax=Tachypleus tridentatus TaxID=6853 RepID=UPI003FCF3846